METNRAIFYASIDMVEDQIQAEQEYWDLREELEPLKPELARLGIEYIDHGNFCSEEGVRIFQDIKKQYWEKIQ